MLHLSILCPFPTENLPTGDFSAFALPLDHHKARPLAMPMPPPGAPLGHQSSEEQSSLQMEDEQQLTPFMQDLGLEDEDASRVALEVPTCHSITVYDTQIVLSQCIFASTAAPDVRRARAGGPEVFDGQGNLTRNISEGPASIYISDQPD